MTKQKIFDAFEAHVKHLKGYVLFWSRFGEANSSLNNVMARLRERIRVNNDARLTMAELDGLIADKNRALKYKPALEALCKAWPSGDYNAAKEGYRAEMQTLYGRLMRVTPQWMHMETTDVPKGWQHLKYKPQELKAMQDPPDPNYYFAPKNGRVRQAEFQAVAWAGLNRKKKHTLLGVYALNDGCGRCFNCAGAALYTLLNDDEFNDYDLAVAKTAYDRGRDGHYYTMVGLRCNPNKNGAQQPGDWYYGYVVDIWEACGVKHMGGEPAHQTFITTIDQNHNVRLNHFIEELYEHSARANDRAIARLARDRYREKEPFKKNVRV